MIPPVIEMMAVLVAAGGGDMWAGEEERALARFDREFERLTALPIWTDDDQDLVQDEDEVYQRQVPFFRRGI